MWLLHNIWLDLTMQWKLDSIFFSYSVCLRACLNIGSLGRKWQAKNFKRMFKFRIADKNESFSSSRGGKSGVMQRIMSIFPTKDGRKKAIIGQSKIFKHTLSMLLV
jgi:hypothetical protein